MASTDIVIIGGAIMGSATAFFLTDMDFDGRVLVVEMDPSYSQCSTAHTNSCIRQQFSSALNVRISQFGAAFITDLPRRMKDPEAPHLAIQNFGYLYLADNDAFAETLRASHAVQAACGAGTRLLTPDQIAEAYPFYNLDDIILGSHNTVNEGYFDGGTMFDWFKRMARRAGVEYIHDEVTAMTLNDNRTQVQSVTLKS